MKITLNPSDTDFRTNIQYLHEAVKDHKLYSPVLFEVTILGERIETRNVRLFQEELIALSADLIHEARFRLADVSEVVVHWRAQTVLVIVEPNKSNRTQSCSIVSLHPSQTLAQIAAMDHFETLGFKVNSYDAMLHELRAHPDYDVVIEEM